ncbi:MAG: hypothetical protein QM767_09005 [Anaeromyxobacter sp.]
MSGGGAFSRRAVVALAVAGALSLAAAFVLGTVGDQLAEPLSAAPDAWSRSALGHRVLLQLLREEGHEVHLSRHGTGRKAADGALVALLEPRQLEAGDRLPDATLEGIAAQAHRLVVVLPKRSGAADPQRRGWLRDHELLSNRPAERILSLLGLEGDVIRPPKLGAWQGELPAPTLHDAQLIRGARLRPLLWTDEGVLVGEAELLVTPAPAGQTGEGPEGEDASGPAAAQDDEDGDGEEEAAGDEAPEAASPPDAADAADEPFASCDGDEPGGCDGVRRVLVVADPDLIAHHGLGEGRNAEIAVGALLRLARPGEAVVVDEILHGHEAQPSVAAEVFAFPLVLTTLQALGTALLLCGAAVAGFGRPRRAADGLAPGKTFLVENTAELLHAGGHVAEALTAYLRAAREEVLARVHPPPGESPDAWLRRVEATRGQEGALAALEARVARLRRRRHGLEHEAIRTARDIHRWREELTDGADWRSARGCWRCRPRSTRWSWARTPRSS